MEELEARSEQRQAHLKSLPKKVPVTDPCQQVWILCTSFSGDRPVLAMETAHPNELLGVSGHQDQTPR